jgi:uncharacterized membrane protein YagU involved in acid resistance
MEKEERRQTMARRKPQPKWSGEKYTNPIRHCLHIGIAAGVFWGLIRWLAVAMNLTRIPVAFLLDPWVKRNVLHLGYWQFAGFVAFLLMSIVAAYVYYGLFRRFRGPLPGLLFGVGWWAVFYAWIGPIAGMVPPLRQIGWDSLITDACLFLMWGLFIGFSIAFEFHDEETREPNPSSATP